MSTGITILLVFIAVVVTLLIAVPVTRKLLWTINQAGC